MSVQEYTFAVKDFLDRNNIDDGDDSSGEFFTQKENLLKILTKEEMAYIICIMNQSAQEKMQLEEDKEKLEEEIDDLTDKLDSMSAELENISDKLKELKG